MRNIIAVASGKGGVGKSTVAVNLAVALANSGAFEPGRIALVDVDFYGPSVPTLMGGGELRVDKDNKLLPDVRYGVCYISIGFFLRKADDPVVWRGPMFSKAIKQLFCDVQWGDVDVCIVDMPPGTGDAQLSLAQSVKLSGAVLVTTPQEVALSDVRKAVNMFKKLEVDVLGVVENMAGFVTDSGQRIDIFGRGGGEALSRDYEIPFLGSIPIDIELRESGDRGEPIALNVESESAKVIDAIAARLVEQIGARESKLRVKN